MHPKKGMLKVWEHMHTTFPPWEKQEIEEKEWEHEHEHEQEQEQEQVQERKEERYINVF